MRQMIHEDNLPEISSEYIEPYLQRWLMMELEGIAIGLNTPDQMKESMKWMQRFASRFCGVHAQFAASNDERRINNLANDKLIEIAKKVFD